MWHPIDLSQLPHLHKIGMFSVHTYQTSRGHINHAITTGSDNNTNKSGYKYRRGGDNSGIILTVIQHKYVIYKLDVNLILNF